ncbi:MAG: DUF1554 domain-containing protein [Labilithrix sp.]|nr:DUF1554 domain-containing protein [Labilithrix sp.]
MLGHGFVAFALAAGMVACFGYASPDEEPESGVDLPGRQARSDAGAPTEPTTIDEPVDAGTDVPEAAPDVAKKPLRAFASSALRSGNLGGLAAADALCNTLAAAKLGGTYKAWLSVPGTNAIDRVTSAGPWFLPTGELVADDKAGLATTQLKHLLNRDENGAALPDAEDRVWTGTTSNGTYSGPDCAQWAGGGTGRVGEANNGGANSWTNLGTEPCSEVNRIYCIEQ